MKRKTAPASTATARLIVMALLALAASGAQAQTVQHVSPVAGFYSKYVDCEGIPIRSSDVVDDTALRQACGKVAMMLKGIPAAKERLIQRGAELHVIGRDQQTSDLPEFRDQRGKTYVDNTGRSTTIDERTRGKGGLKASCGEENILHLSSDRYRDGSDICIHEFAHTIMTFGFTQEQRARIIDQYRRSLAKGLWQNAYGAVDPREFWAELSMWYFGSHGAHRKDGPQLADGPQGLKAYDPDAYDLLNRLYHGGG